MFYPEKNMQHIHISGLFMLVLKLFTGYRKLYSWEEKAYKAQVLLHHQFLAAVSYQFYCCCCSYGS